MAPLFLKNEEKRDNLKVINPFLRSAAYKKLSSLFTYPENNESYRQFRDEKREIKDIFAELSTEYDIDFQDDVDSLTSAVDGLSLQDIQVEYVRLFDYRPKCLIVESAYIYRRDKSTDPEKCASVRDGVEDFYSRFGLETGCWFKQPPDHLSVELEFMHYLTHQEGVCMKDESDEVGRYLEGEKEFLSEHLLEWAVGFCDCLRDNSCLSLYSSLAGITKALLLNDARYLQNLEEVLA